MRYYLMIFISFVICLNVTLALRNRLKKKGGDYIDEERMANYARKRDIGPELFFTADLSVLPLREKETAGESLYKRQSEAVARAGKKMIRFERRMTNRELKLSYGAGSLELIAQYEENYNGYIRCLINWGEELFNNNEIGDARRVLEEAVKSGSRFERGYKLLGGILVSQADHEGLDRLRETVSQMDFFDEGEVYKRQILSSLAGDEKA